MRKKFIGLDGLRAISIIMVMCSHAGVEQLLPSNKFWHERAFQLFNGGTGVQLFFVISGFLITHLLFVEAKESGKISLYNFYARRFLRLFPALYLYLTVVSIFMALGLIARNYIGIAAAGIYLFNFMPKIFISSELSHLWSLAVEEQFYLIWPILFACLSRKRAFIFAAVALALSAVLFQSGLAFQVDVQSEFMTKIFQLLKINPAQYAKYFQDGHYFYLDRAFYTIRFLFPAMGLILSGCMAAYLWSYRQDLVRRWAKIIALLGVLLYACPLFLPQNINNLWSIIQSFGFAGLILAVVASPNASVVKQLEAKPLVYIGTISYGLYLWHGLFIGTDLVKAWWQAPPMGFVYTAIVSVASYELYEKRFLLLKNRFKSSELNKAGATVANARRA